MILSAVKVEDFDRFWNTFSTKGAEKRKGIGSRGARVFRDPDEDDRLLVLLDLDEEGYNKLVSDPELPALFQAAGLQAPPERAELAGETDA